MLMGSQMRKINPFGSPDSSHNDMPSCTQMSESQSLLVSLKGDITLRCRSYFVQKNYLRCGNSKCVFSNGLSYLSPI